MSARPNLPNSASESLPSSNMDSTAILSLLEQLDDEIDDLEESLTPILKTALSETTSKLPLLDKAKLYVLVTYAIESILFSYLRLHGVKAREHPVYKELTRVRQYFDKIKSAEAPLIENENPSIDKRAAGRFIRAGLSGNDKYDLERAERQAKERARAHIRFEEVSNARESQSAAPDGSGGTGCRASEDAESDSEDAKEINSPATVSSRKRKAASSVPTQQLQQLQQNTEKSKGKKRAKRGQGQGQGQGK